MADEYTKFDIRTRSFVKVERVEYQYPWGGTCQHEYVTLWTEPTWLKGMHEHAGE